VEALRRPELAIGTAIPSRRDFRARSRRVANVPRMTAAPITHSKVDCPDFLCISSAQDGWGPLHPSAPSQFSRQLENDGGWTR
jgi:hypothetical protein